MPFVKQSTLQSFRRKGQDNKKTIKNKNTIQIKQYKTKKYNDGLSASNI